MMLDETKTPMTSTPGSKDTETQDASAPRGDERLTQAHEQIKRADEQLSRLTEQLARMEREAAPPPSTGPAPQSPPAAEPAPPPPQKMPRLRTLVALPIAACIIVAALVLQSTYGDGAKLIVARWAPQRAAAPALPPEDPPAPAQSTPSAVQLASVEAASPPQVAPSPAPPAPTLAQVAPPQEARPATAAAPPSDQTQLLQTMARDLANLERNIEQLRTNQQQMASDNAKAIGELKASQDDMKRALAKVSDQAPPRVSSLPAPPATALRKPERQRPQARARPRYPYPQEWLYDDW
jgi:molecular chaperone GrpE (heat shock protein)